MERDRDGPREPVPWTDKELKQAKNEARIAGRDPEEVKGSLPISNLQMTAEMKSHSKVARLYEAGCILSANGASSIPGAIQCSLTARKQQASVLAENQAAYGGELPFWSSEQEEQFEAAAKERKAADKEYDEASDALKDLKQEERKYVWDVQDIYFRESQGQKLSLRERSIKDAWEDTSPLPEAVKRFFDLFSHDSVAHFNFDTSRLSDWRMLYFGDSKFKPN